MSAWRLADICAQAERAYGVRYSGWGMSRLLERLGLSRQKARPRPPRGSAAERAAFEKGAWVEARRDRRGAPGRAGPALVRGWLDAARSTGSGRRAGPATAGTNAACARPGSPTDKRFASLSLFAACRPGADQAFALALLMPAADRIFGEPV